MAFNPDNHKPSKEQSDKGYDDREIPTGEYLLGLTWWKRISANAVKFRAEVLAGPMKGASCFPTVATNVEEKKGSADRMFFFCKAFCISGDLDFSDQCMEEKFLGSAGKAKIERKKNGNFTNHDFRKFFARGEASENERVIMVEWEEAFASRSSGGGVSDGDFDDEAPMPDSEWDVDDDIPF